MGHYDSAAATAPLIATLHVPRISESILAFHQSQNQFPSFVRDQA